eukprot:scaffold450473_cov42-Prasinocladus_malaysianus.AAC.1
MAHAMEAKPGSSDCGTVNKTQHGVELRASRKSCDECQPQVSTPGTHGSPAEAASEAEQGQSANARAFQHQHAITTE